MVEQPSAIEEVDGARFVDPQRFQEEIVCAGRPVVLRGLATHWPLVRAAHEGTDAFRTCLVDGSPAVPVDLFSGDREIEGRYFYNDDLSGFNFDRVATSFAEAVATILEGAHEGAARTSYLGSVPLAGALAPLAGELRLACLPSSVTPRLWLGNRSDVSCHYDMMDNLACVVAGRRQFVLFPPDAIGDLYVGPLDHTMAGQPVSLAASAPASEQHRFPRFQAARERARTAVLEPGDGLYMPKLWWHQVRGLAPLNGLVNYWWDATASGPDSPNTAMLLAMVTLADRPLPERLAWRAFFDHYAFRPERHPLEHLPLEKHGVLGDRSPVNHGKIRAAVAQALRLRLTSF